MPLDDAASTATTPTRTAREPLRLGVDACVDHIVSTFGSDIRIGMPLGLGKPVPLINALYRRAKADPSLKLTIFTALSLEKPRWGSELERRFLEPFVERVWGDVPDLAYMQDLRDGGLPPNVRLHEIFFKAGAYRGLPRQQQDYISSNYTHVVRDCEINGNQIFAHIVARGEGPDGRPRYSASCNADTSLKTLREFAQRQQEGIPKLRIAMVHPRLPYMHGDAEVDPSMYDIVIDDDEGDYGLFSTPRQPLTDVDHLIGLNTSALVRDGGTLQIGIGALGDSIAHALILRHREPEGYRALLADTGVLATSGGLIEQVGGTGPLAQGLYGSTEMLVDGFLQLYKAGIVRRPVYHHAGLQALANDGVLAEGRPLPEDLIERLWRDGGVPRYLDETELRRLQHFGILREDLRWEDGDIVDGDERFSAVLDRADTRRRLARGLGPGLRHGVLLTGGFFLGPQDFYDSLLNMPEAERRRFEMTGVEVANQLYGNERLRSLQRKDGRFCNTAMKATLLGHMVSDGTEDGQVVSGVGGQYNFVAMAHALDDGRLVMMVKSTRQEGGRTLSNIVDHYGHVTIPRHLRDLVVTEYGIADLRGRCDQEVIKAMLNVADSRFQEELLAGAIAHGKLPPDTRIPEAHRHNTPERLAEVLKAHKAAGRLPPFPFGTELTPAELACATALKALKAAATHLPKETLAERMAALPAQPPAALAPVLRRMGLDDVTDAVQQQMQRSVMLGLQLAGLMPG